MYSEAKKLHVIQEMLKVKNEKIWMQVEKILETSSANETADDKQITTTDFSFLKSRTVLHNLNGSLSEALVEERRSAQ